MSLREQKMQRKKEDIMRAAVSIFSEKGYYGTTMEDVAAKLLMTKGSVYYYFDDKQDLLFQCQTMLLARSIEHVEVVMKEELPARKKLQQAIVVHIENILSDRSGFEMMIKPEQFFTEDQQKVILKLRDYYGQCFDQLISQGVREGIFNTSDIKIVRNIMLGAMNSVLQWFSNKGKKDETEFAEIIAHYLLCMLVKEEEKECN